MTSYKTASRQPQDPFSCVPTEGSLGSDKPCRLHADEKWLDERLTWNPLSRSFAEGMHAMRFILLICRVI